jgi:hypothetical protein
MTKIPREYRWLMAVDKTITTLAEYRLPTTTQFCTYFGMAAMSKLMFIRYSVQSVQVDTVE